MARCRRTLGVHPRCVRSDCLRIDASRDSSCTHPRRPGCSRFPKVHSAPTPLLGGLAIYVAFATAILANSILDYQVSAILIGGSLLVIVGILDDILDIPAFVHSSRLIAAAIVIGSGVAITLFPRFWVGDFVDTILTVVWLLGITNAMNFFDGMDGLATGLSIISASFLGLFAFLSFQPFLGWFFPLLLVGKLL